MLFDMAMTRSYFLRGSLDFLGALQATIAVLKFTLVVIEEIPKHHLFHSSSLRLGPAERGGFWGRALLLWVTPILRLGFVKDLSVDELPHIGDQYDSEPLFDKFVPNWNEVAAMGTYMVTKKMASARTAWNTKVETRVAATSNFLAQLKSIKAMGLTDAISTYLQEKRLDEIETSMIEQTFAAYAAIFIATVPLNSLLGHLPYYASGYACFLRVQKFLTLPERRDQRESTERVENEAEKTEKNETVHGRPSKYAVTMNNVSVNSDFSGPILKDVTLRVPTGSLAMMHGLVSSGKSAFLKTIMGELSVNTGTLEVASKIIAYTSQTPWIRNATIKENIIGPYPFAEELYNEVVFACALDKDIADLPDGDSTKLLEEADIVFEISHQGRVRQKQMNSRNNPARGVATNVREETPGPEMDVPATCEEFEPPSVDLGGQVPETNKPDQKRRHGDLSLYGYYFRTAHCLLFVTWFTVAAIAAVMERMPRKHSTVQFQF
ncbi:hypothetical protein ACQRIT_000491 [Beauveria bassiana]